MFHLFCLCQTDVKFWLYLAFNLRNNLDLRRSSKLKRILPSQADTRQDTPRVPATSNSLSINNRENISQNNIIDADEATSITDPDFYTANTGNIANRTLTPTSQKKKNRRTRSNNSSNSPEEQKETVINLSTAQLSNTEIKLLSRGLTFVPTPKRINWSEIQADINDFARRLRLKEFFQNNQTNSTNPSDEVRKRFRCKGTWAPPNGRDAALDAFISAVENDIMSSKPRPIRNNLSRKERKALTTLRKRTDIVIKPADKGSGTVIMDHSWYVNECDRQLNDTKYYQKQSSDLTNRVQERVKEYSTRLHKDNLIDSETLKYLSSTSEPKAGRFYILPKIHKQGNPGRPIISSNGHPTERISEFVNYHLKPLVQNLPSFIKDTTHFLLQLQKLGPLPDNALLVTLDVSSLYTNIPHNEGIDACRYFLNTRQDKLLPAENICDLIRMILTMNNFSFNNEHYLQKHGTAMGTRMAPSYANLFMGKFEQQAIDNSSLKPFIWWRFIDDIFMIWTHGEEHLKTFIGYLNSIHPSIEFTHEYSNSLRQTLPFLDVQVHLINNHIQTDLHTKPTDKHQYLLKTSCHPNHTKRAIPFSLFLRIRRICSTETFFDQRSRELIEYLTKRGYSRTSLQRDANRVRSIPRHATLQPQEPKSAKTDRTPFVTSFNPALPKISSVVNKYTTLLQATANCKKAFPNPPVIAYRRNASLRDLLVHSTLSHENSSSQQPAGIKKCNHPRCLTCSFLQEGQTNYTFFTTNENRKITDSISCHSKNLIYMIECTKCHLQYIGETKRQLNERFGEHRRSILNHHQLSITTPVSLHFNQAGHSINDVHLIPIELIRSKRDSIRKAREAHLINKAKTLHPFGINRRDETRQ